MNFLKKRDIETLTAQFEKITHELQKNNQEIIQKIVVTEASIYAKKGLPKFDDPLLEPYLTKIRAKYLALKHEVEIKARGNFQRIMGSMNVLHYTDKIKDVIEKRKQWIHKRDNFEIDAGKISVAGKFRMYRKHQWLLFLLALAESLNNTSGFLKIGDIVLIAGTVGIIVGLAEVYAAKFIVLNIRESVNRSLRRKYYVAAAAGFFVFSLLLGMLRYHFVPQEITSTTSLFALNPFFFAGVNFLFAFAAALVTHFLAPTKRDMEEMEHRKSIEIEIKDCDAAIKLLDARHALLENEQLEVKTLHAEALHGGARLEQMIGNFYDEATGTFKSENLIKREDGIVPICFNNPVAPLPPLNNDFLHP